MKKYLLGPSAVRKLDAVLRGKGEVSSSPLAGAGVTDERGFEVPYTVRWAQSENSGSGAWLIWLPSETLLMVGSAAVDPSAELTAAQDYPDGWYVLDFLSSSSGGDIYLNVHQPKEGEPTANFTDEPDEPETDETVTPVLVATASANSTTGERKVKQFVSSTITIGGKGDSAPLPWDVKVENGNAYVFSPVIFVVEGGAGGKFRTLTKVIPSGCTENSWNRVDLNAHDNISCTLAVSVSGSGSRSYVASLTGGLPIGSYVELTFFRVAKFQINASLAPLKVLQQYVHGEQVFLDFGSQDRRSISLNEDGETEIKGFKSQASETSKLAQHLTADSEFDGQVLVRITDQQGKKQLVFMPIGNGIGGGGGTTGYTGTIDVPTGNMRCNAASGYYIQNEFKTWTFENGLLKSVGEAQWPTSGGLATTPLSGT